MRTSAHPWRHATLGVTTLALAATLMISLLTSGTRRTPTAMTPKGVLRGAQLASYVRTGTVNALSHSNGYIEQVSEQTDRFSTLTFHYATNLYRVDASGVSTDLYTINPGVSTVLDHFDDNSRTWYEVTEPWSGVRFVPATQGLQAAPSQLEAFFRRPSWKILAVGTLRGQRAYQMQVPLDALNAVGQPGNAPSAGVVPTTTSVWVDANTFLPVQITTSARSGAVAGVGIRGGTATQEISWEPATPANLTATTLHPPGFRRVPAPSENPLVVPPGH